MSAIPPTVPFGRSSRRRGPGYERLLAWRIVRSRKSRFLSLITLVAIVGIACGVMALTIVLSVTGGFQEAFRDRILGLHPHMYVVSQDHQLHDYRDVIARLRRDPRVTGATPTTYDEMMLAHGDQRAGAVVKGIDLQTVGGVLDVKALLTTGTIDALNETPRVEPSGGVIRLENIVHGTSWTVVLWGDDRVLVHEEDLSPADSARIVVLHVAPDVGPIDVALELSETALVSGLEPGQASRGLRVPVGATGLRLGDTDLLTADQQLHPGTAVVVLLLPAGKVQILPVVASPPGEGEARLRVVDARPPGSAPRVVRVGDVEVRPGETGTIPGRLPAIVLGEALARRLKAKAGDTIALASPFRGLGDAGGAPTGMDPTSGRYRVAGTFLSGYYDYDKRFSLVSFTSAVRFRNIGDQAKWIELRVDDVLRVDERKRVVETLLEPRTLGQYLDGVRAVQKETELVLQNQVSQLPMETPASLLATLRNVGQVLRGLRVRLSQLTDPPRTFSVVTWQEVYAPIFGALKLQKVVLSIFFLIIIVVAAFNVVGTQVLMVNQKVKEIAILKAMGAPAASVKRVFLLQGLMISALGTAIGLAMGLLACWALHAIGYPLEPEVYLIDRLPVDVSAVEVTAVALAALLLTLLATLYSSGRAARLMPVSGIRYIE